MAYPSVGNIKKMFDKFKNATSFKSICGNKYWTPLRRSTVSKDKWVFVNGTSAENIPWAAGEPNGGGMN